MRCNDDNGLRSFLYESVLFDLDGYDDSIEDLINKYQSNGSLQGAVIYTKLWYHIVFIGAAGA